MAKEQPKPASAPVPGGKIVPQPIVSEMETSYLDYAMSVIISRALPDVRDGLKPVHRRILYAMSNMGLRANAKFRKSATVVGECFVRDTLIVTSRGLVPIQDIRPGHEVYTQHSVHKVLRSFEIPPRPLLKVTFENGLSNIVTRTQQFKVLTPDLEFVWKGAKDLTSKDYVVSRAVYPDLKKYVSLKTTTKEFPRTFTPELAYLLGLLMSDGWVTQEGKRQRLGFCARERVVLEYIVSIITKFFSYTPNIEKKSYVLKSTDGREYVRHLYSVRINRDAVNNFFIENFALEHIKARSKFVPSKILCSPKSVIFAFVAGLIDGDGSIHKQRNVINYGSISHTLVDRLQLVLQQCGIFGKRLVQQAKSHVVNGRFVYSNSPLYSLEFNGKNALQLARQLPLRSPEKVMRVERFCDALYKQSSNDIVPYAASHIFPEMSRLHIGAGWYLDAIGQKFRLGIKYKGGTKIRYASNLCDLPIHRTQLEDWGILNKLIKIGSPLAAFLQRVMVDNIYFARVTSVKDAPSAPTYDFEVETDHEFIANGVISHNCLGKYHPHGDIAVYDAMVRMAQDFSMRYPLVAGQGNFGSVDGDSAAAQRYTEAKLSPVAEELLTDLEKETVDFMPNYDGTQEEPKVMPAAIPNLLLNGTVGIAVGMATNIPPHNLSEISDAVMALIDDSDVTVEDLMKHLKGPDFPTGGLIYNLNDIKQTYATGKGPIVMRAKTEITEDKQGQFRILITEIPYQVNKASLLEKIAELVREKKIEGIRDLRDESSKEGLRIVVELKKDAYPKKVLNRLFQATQLQETFHVNLLALVDGIQPRVLNLKMVLEEFIKHREQVVRRRAAYELARAKERAHILEGLKIALLHIDKVIETIKKSKDRDDARINLISKFKLTEIQANAILDMRLSQLAALERLKIENELKEKQALIEELEALLKSPKKIFGVIRKETEELKKKFGDERRTQVVAGGVKEFSMEDVIPDEPAVLMITRDGYIKRLPPDTFRTQRRGGKGVIGLATKEEDVVEQLLSTTTHADLLFFTTRGRVFKLKAYDVPQASRTSKGMALVNFLQLAPAEKVSATLSASDLNEYKFLVMVTKAGTMKKTDIKDFEVVRRSGIIALRLHDEDTLEWVKPSTGADEVVLTTAKGQAIRFREKDVRSMGRVAAGVRGVRLSRGDSVVSLDVVDPEMIKKGLLELLVVMENGFGKRSNLKLYKVQHRGGKGIRTAKVTAKTGEIVYAQISNAKDERDLIVISENGQVIRIPFGTISVLGRQTQGVRIMRFKEEKDSVASVTFV